MNEAIISTKGQIVIPREMRKRYRLHPNTTAVWVDAGSALLVFPRENDPVRASRGLLKGSKLTLKALKKERKNDKKSR